MKSAEASAVDELVALETGALDPALFPHPEHVRLAYEMLGRHPFGEAVTRFSRGLRLLAAKAGRPEVYNETITVAFLALIGERRARAKHTDWPEFKMNNSDLWINVAWNHGMTRTSYAPMWLARLFACRDRAPVNRRGRRLFSRRCGQGGLGRPSGPSLPYQGFCLAVGHSCASLGERKESFIPNEQWAIKQGVARESLRRSTNSH